MHYLEEMVSLQGVLKSIFYLIVELSYCSVLEVYQATLETCLDLKSILFFIFFTIFIVKPMGNLKRLYKS
jgi:hypothetical protein